MEGSGDSTHVLMVPISEKVHIQWEWEKEGWTFILPQFIPFIEFVERLETKISTFNFENTSLIKQDFQ
jgi:hypothetical protein